MCGLVEAMNMGTKLIGRQFDISEIALLSVGVGDVGDSPDASRSKPCDSTRSLVDFLLDGSSEAVHQQVKTMFEVRRSSY